MNNQPKTVQMSFTKVTRLIEIADNAAALASVANVHLQDLKKGVCVITPFQIRALIAAADEALIDISYRLSQAAGLEEQDDD